MTEKRKAEVAQAILLDQFLPITISLKLQLKFDGTGNAGDFTVLRVQAYQVRSGQEKKLSVHLKDIVWNFVEKNWGRVQYWINFGKGSTLMFSTKTNILPQKSAVNPRDGKSKGNSALRRSRSSGQIKCQTENSKKTAKTVKKQDSIKLVIETKMEKEEPEIGKPGKSENPAVPELGNPGNLEKSGEPELEKPEILTKTVSQPCLHKDIPKIDILEVGEKPECGKTENLSKTENFTEEIGEKKSASSPAIKAKSERKPQIKKKN